MNQLQLKSLLFESEPESGPEAVFGKYAFDSKREDIPKEELEPQTEVEDEVQLGFVQYFIDNKKAILDRRSELLMKLIDKGLYSQLLDPYGSHRFVFRKLYLTKQIIKDRFGIDVSKEQSGTVFKTGTLEPKGSKLSGWSVKPTFVAKFVGLDASKEDEVQVVFRSPLTKPNRFFAKPGAIDGLFFGDDEEESEMETIGVGPITYDAFTWSLVDQSVNIGSIALE